MRTLLHTILVIGLGVFLAPAQGLAQSCTSETRAAMETGASKRPSMALIKSIDKNAFDEIISNTCVNSQHNGTFDSNRALIYLAVNMHEVTAERVQNLADQDILRAFTFFNSYARSISQETPSWCSMLLIYTLTPTESPRASEKLLRAENAFFTNIWTIPPQASSQKIVPLSQVEAFFSQIDYGSLDYVDEELAGLIALQKSVGEYRTACMIADAQVRLALRSGRADIIRSAVAHQASQFRSVLVERLAAQ